VTVHQKIRPKDVPGTLLNMALLNLGSSDPNLRTAAYNQLCALTATFDLKIEGQLLETSGKLLNVWNFCMQWKVLYLMFHSQPVWVVNTLPSAHVETRDCYPMCCWWVTHFYVFLHDILHIRLSAVVVHFLLHGYQQLNAGCLGLKLQINRSVITPYF